MLGYLILAILIGFIAVDIIRSRPKPQPKVTKEATLKCDKPEPVVPAPEEAPKETFVCPNCKRELNKKYLYKRGLCVDCVTNPQKYGKSVLTSSTPGNMTLPERLNFEQGLGLSPKDRSVYIRESGEYRRREQIVYYLEHDQLDVYLKGVVPRWYGYRRSDYYYDYHSYHLLFDPYTYSINTSIRLLDELYSSSKGQQLGIKSKYVETLKKFLQSDERSDYYTALDYIYNQVLLETDPNTNVRLKLKILDDAELYKLFKDSIPKHIDFLKTISYGEVEERGCTLYEFAQEIDKMFRSALEQRKLPVPE